MPTSCSKESSLNIQTFFSAKIDPKLSHEWSHLIAGKIFAGWMFAKSVEREKSGRAGQIMMISERWGARMLVRCENNYSTCSDDDFLGQLSRNCQFCSLSRCHRSHYKSQTPTASHPCPPELALQCSPGGWCPLERSPPCVGNSRDTGHLGQTTVASSSSNFRPKIVFIINWCYKKNRSLKNCFHSFFQPTCFISHPSLSGEKKVYIRSS